MDQAVAREVVVMEQEKGVPPAATALRYATVEEERHNLMRSIVSALAEHPERAQSCVQMSDGNPIQPPEVWIEDSAAWVRLDGTWCGFDVGRGAFKPTSPEAVRIRLAAERWTAAQGIEAAKAGETREAGLDPKDESPVTEGHAPKGHDHAN